MIKGLLAIFFFSSTISLYAQRSEALVSERFRNVPLSRALKTIQDNYDVKVAYDHALVKNVRVSLTLLDVTVVEAISGLLNGTSLSFHSVGPNLIIVPAVKAASAQVPLKLNFALSGKVYDTETNETLPQATVRVAGTQIITTTNNDGYFTLLGIPNDTTSLEVSYMGYVTKSIPLNTLNDANQLDVGMKSDSKILNEIVVLDEYNTAIHVDGQAGALTINPKSLDNLPSLGEQDIARTMQLMPGVTATDESAAGMVVRGMHAGYNLVTLDGMTIYQQDHFFGAYSIINCDIIKDVRFHKGIFDAKYGGRVSGVVDITTKNGNAAKPAFNFTLNGINAKATAEIPIARKWSFFAGARRSLTDVMQSALFNKLFDIASKSNDQIQLFQIIDGIQSGTAPQYYFYDVNSKLTFRPSQKDIISLSFYVSRDEMTISDSTSFSNDYQVVVFGDDEITHWGNNGLSLRWGRQWGDRFYSNVRVSDSKFFRHHDYQQWAQVDDVHSTFRLMFENDITDLSYAVENEWLMNDRISWDFGISGVRQQTRARVSDSWKVTGDPEMETPDASDETRTAGSWLHAVYGSANGRVSDRLTLTAGARFSQYQNQQRLMFLEPRVSARLQLHERVNLKGAYGRSTQFLSPMIQYTQNGAVSGINENYWVLAGSDGAVPVIQADHVTTGVSVKTANFVYDAEGYYKHVTGMVSDEDLNSGIASVYGVELMAQKVTGIHKGWITYSLGRGEQTHAGIPDGGYVPTLQDQRHEIKVVDMLSLGRWNLSSTVIFGSGKPYPRYIVKYHRDSDGVIQSYDLFLDYNNQARLPEYFRIDLAASYKVQIKNRVGVEAGLSIYNVTDHTNIKTRRINRERLDEARFTTTAVEPTYTDIVLLGFSPNLFLRISF